MTSGRMRVTWRNLILHTFLPLWVEVGFVRWLSIDMYSPIGSVGPAVVG